MHFHHRDPTQKDPEWKTLKFKALAEMKRELDKCDLVCANCHAEIHWERLTPDDESSLQAASTVLRPGKVPRELRL
jgi:predicted HNH restriction endonuclease